MKTFLLVVVMVFSLGVTGISANKSNSEKNNPKIERRLSDEEINRMTKRLEEIQAMDKSTLTPAERKDLRKEVKGIRHALADGGYVYISVGTLLVIALILLLIL